jgi:hypothetical protein
MNRSYAQKRGLVRAFALAFWIANVAACLNVSAEESTCPEGLKAAKRLLVVTANGMEAHTGMAYAYQRQSLMDPWKGSGSPKRATLGFRGLGWGWDQYALSAGNEPRKREGDGRTPAGIFAIGKAFGIAPRGPGSEYIRLQKGKTYCVNDLRSERYNTIVSKDQIGSDITGEDMGAVSLYRRGLLVGFPANREKKGGSCIFIHIWRRPGAPTNGCVALREEDVAEIQDWTGGETAYVAILPKDALARVRTCLPDPS